MFFNGRAKQSFFRTICACLRFHRLFKPFMKTRFFIFIWLILGISVKGIGQKTQLYPLLFEMMNADRRISYVQFGREKPMTSDRLLRLEPQEGGSGFVAEPYLDFSFPVFQKQVLKDINVDPLKENKKDQNIRPLWGYSRIILNYNFHTKITKTRSSPILPPTNSFGIQLDRLLFMRRFDQDTVDVIKTGFRNAFQIKKTMHAYGEHEKVLFVYLSVLFKHYSNGQDGKELKEPFNRGNYENGNFSTNFISPKITASLLDTRNWLYHFSVAYQREIGDSTGFLSLEETQSDRRYGLNRLRIDFQIRGNLSFFDNNRLLRRLKPIEWRFRTEFEQILDLNLDQYPYSRKFRSGANVYFELSHVYIRSLGLFVHGYWGRDPLNIRYDDPIKFLKFGITIEPGKYTSSRGDLHSVK